MRKFGIKNRKNAIRRGHRSLEIAVAIEEALQANDEMKRGPRMRISSKIMKAKCDKRQKRTRMGRYRRSKAVTNEVSSPDVIAPLATCEPAIMKTAAAASEFDNSDAGLLNAAQHK